MFLDRQMLLSAEYRWRAFTAAQFTVNQAPRGSERTKVPEKTKSGPGLGSERAFCCGSSCHRCWRVRRIRSIPKQAANCWQQKAFNTDPAMIEFLPPNRIIAQ